MDGSYEWTFFYKLIKNEIGIITVNNSILANGESVDSIDITSMLMNMVPDELKDIFNIVVNEVNENPNK